MITVLLVLVGTIAFFFFSRSLFGLLFSMDSHKNYQKRMRQLQFSDEGKKVNDDTREAIDKVTAPIIRYVFPRLKVRDTESLNRDLKIAGWESYFNADQYRAMNLLLKVVGVILGILFYQFSPVMGAVWFILPFFGLGFFFNNSLKERQRKIFQAFPDFIRVIQGYLSAGVPLAKAVEEAFPYMSPEWKKIMKSFLINTNLMSLNDAIVRINEDVDIFEIQEFFSLIKLNLEQGIDVKESFSSQREKVMDLQYEVMLNKIGQRQLMATLIQGPLLLTLIFAFGLPTLDAMMHIGG